MYLPRSPRVRVREATSLALGVALAGAACTHGDTPGVATLQPEPPSAHALPSANATESPSVTVTAAPETPPAPAPAPSSAPMAEGTTIPQGGAMAQDLTAGRVRVSEGEAPYVRVGDPRSRVGPRWVERSTGRRVSPDDPAFRRWLSSQTGRVQRVPGQ
ncbi:MAG: hypothetical protein HY909_01000 [Deltaproteobacteria bacterium]|nr:hypothetical protein [Deltaproteobacteria bacterium]